MSAISSEIKRSAVDQKLCLSPAYGANSDVQSINVLLVSQRIAYGSLRRGTNGVLWE